MNAFPICAYKTSYEHTRSRYPSQFLESDFELVGDLLSSSLGSALNLAAAARLPIDFHPAADNETHGIPAGNGDDSR